MAHEIEQNDSMFSVGQRAWHGLGTVLDKAPTISEALTSAKLNWEVKTEALFTASGERVDAQATRRVDTQEVLGVVGPNYHVVQNIEALNVFQPLVDTGLVTLETAGSLRNGRRVWILAKITEIQESRVGSNGNDSVIPYWLLSNSHDGKTAVRMGFTPTRVVCANTLAAAQRSSESKLIRVTHTSKVMQNLETLRDAMNLAKRDFEVTLEQYRYLASRDIATADLENYVRVVFDLPKPEERQRAGLPKALEKCIESFDKDAHTYGATWWSAYNAVQGFMQHEQGRSQDARLDQLWFGPNQSRNVNALELAVAMAAT